MTILDRFSVEGRLALVTGGSRGIGFAIARGLHEAGARVVVSSRSGDACERAAATLGDGAEGVACDVTQPEDVARLMAHVERAGGVDLLACCAGVAASSWAAEMPRAELQRMLDIHLHGAIAPAQAAHGQMKAKGTGSILLVTSVWGLGGQPSALAYGSAKAALAHAVKVLALEWARDGIRVNGLAPGYVETDMTAEMTPAVRERLLARVPMRRAAAPEEMAGPALLLLSDAGSYVTGQTLVADGGERAR